MNTGSADRNEPASPRLLREIVTAQVRGREQNDAVRATTEQDPFEVGCECGLIGCDARLLIEQREYDAVRTHARRFIVAVGHGIDEIEATVARSGGHAVVEKFHGPGSDAAEGL